MSSSFADTVEVWLAPHIAAAGRGPGDRRRPGEHRLAAGHARGLWSALAPPAHEAGQRPHDHVAYVFMDRSDAQAHLHELWLRELQ